MLASKNYVGVGLCTNLVAFSTSTYAYMLCTNTQRVMLKLNHSDLSLVSAIQIGLTPTKRLNIEKVSVSDSSEKFILGMAENNAGAVDFVIVSLIDFGALTQNTMEVKSIATSSGTTDRYQRVIGKFYFEY